MAATGNVDPAMTSTITASVAPTNLCKEGRANDLLAARLRGGLEGGCPRRTSARILGWWHGAADRLSPHTGPAETRTSLDREDRRGGFVVRPVDSAGGLDLSRG